MKHKQAAAGPISTQIIVQPVVRTVHDVASWRSTTTTVASAVN